MKHKTLWGLVLGIGLLFGGALLSQPFQDPLFHTFRPGDPSAGIYWGITFPSIVSTGTFPPDGVLFIQRTVDAGAAPEAFIYSDFSGAWLAMLMSPAAGLTDNTVPVWDGVANVLEDSGIVDDANNIIVSAPNDITVTSTGAVGGDVDLLSASGDILLETTLGPIVIDAQGATMDLFLEAADDVLVTAADDVNFTITDSFIVASDNFDVTLALAYLTTTGDIDLETTDTGDIVLTSAADIELTPTDDTVVTAGTLLLPDGLVGEPSWGWTSDDDGTGTGMYRAVADSIDLVVNGVLSTRFNVAGLRTTNGTAGVPVYGFSGDGNTGIYRPAADNLGFTVGGALVVDFEDTNAAGTGADLVTISSTLGAMDGTDTVTMLFIDPAVVADSGGALSNTLNGALIDSITQDADTAGFAVHVETGWDAALYSEGIAHANLAGVPNGSMVFCTNCDPGSTACTTGGASTGAFAFRVNGQWDCGM